MPLSKNLRRLFLQTLAFASLALWLASAILAVDYAETRPEAPVPDRGRVYAVALRERLVYLTLPECVLFYGLMGLGGGGGIVSITVWARWKWNGQL